MDEQWRDIVGFPGYQVSSAGRARSLDRVVYTRRASGVFATKRQGRILKAGTRSRYSYVTLSRSEKQTQHLLHKLVLEAFVGPCPAGLEIRHLTGITTDNSLENLRYGTSKENSLDAAFHRTHPGQIRPE